MRLRTDLAYGTITDAPLLIGATTVSSAELPRLDKVVGSPDIMEVTLDPRRVNGEPEIVHVTAYDGSATSATILRGREGTAAREHPAGTEWAHTATALDHRAPGTAKVRRVAQVASPGGAVTFDETTWNLGGLVTVGSDRLTFQRAAIVQVSGQIRWVSSGTHTAVARLYTSADASKASPARHQASGHLSASIGGHATVVAGDYLRLLSFHQVATDILSDADGETALSVMEVRAL